MIFTPYQAAEPIAPYIEAIFHYKDFVPDHSIERVVPTGHVFIIFELDGIERHTFDNETLRPNANYTRAWICGMHRNYFSISAHENSEMFVIQFKPHGSYPFLHVAADMLNELIVPAHEVIDDSLYTLRDAMRQTDDTAEKFSAAEHWLLSRFDPEKLPPVELLDFIQHLQEEPVDSLNALIDAYPASQKSLIDQFKKFVGLTPKYYQRILRFNDLLKRIQNKDQISWTEIANECGYFDQSHFIKEFRHFSGFNPKEYIGKDYNKDEPNFFPLDRKE